MLQPPCTQTTTISTYLVPSKAAGSRDSSGHGHNHNSVLHTSTASSRATVTTSNQRPPICNMILLTALIHPPTGLPSSGLPLQQQGAPATTMALANLHLAQQSLWWHLPAMPAASARNLGATQEGQAANGRMRPPAHMLNLSTVLLHRYQCTLVLSQTA